MGMCVLMHTHAAIWYNKHLYCRNPEEVMTRYTWKVMLKWTLKDQESCVQEEEKGSFRHGQEREHSRQLLLCALGPSVDS